MCPLAGGTCVKYIYKERKAPPRARTHLVDGVGDAREVEDVARLEDKVGADRVRDLAAAADAREEGAAELAQARRRDRAADRGRGGRDEEAPEEVAAHGGFGQLRARVAAGRRRALAPRDKGAERALAGAAREEEGRGDDDVADAPDAWNFILGRGR
jgi:hypothetical protein